MGALSGRARRRLVSRVGVSLQCPVRAGASGRPDNGLTGAVPYGIRTPGILHDWYSVRQP